MLYKKTDCYELYQGKMEEELSALKDNSVDSIITDPPYELNFMNKGWDNAGVSFQKETWEKCLRVLKPGGHLLAFGGSRTFHRIACAIEDAGFEIRDTIMWIYGSGFPKSMSLGKVIEGKQILGSANVKDIKKLDGTKELVNAGWSSYEVEQGKRNKEYEKIKTNVNYTTELGKKWDGWGTCLKPSYEPIIIARKPPIGSLVDNVIEYGVGGINIDECRISHNEPIKYTDRKPKDGSVFNTDTSGYDNTKNYIASADEKGRFPANTILTYDETDFEEVCGGFPETSSNGGITTMPDLRDVGKKSKESVGIDKLSFGQVSNAERKESNYVAPTDSGSASRYFYCAKASKKDRDEGLDLLEDKYPANAEFRPNHMEKALSGEDGTPYGRWQPRKNIHPTVKPTDLMQYLVRLVSPKGATVLDPFMGSGSTGKAVMFENRERNANYKFIGIEMTEDYLPICEARINYAMNYVYSDDDYDISKQPTITSYKKELW